jgi:hypothetical protein
MNADQLDIKEVGHETFRLEFPYNPDFIEFIKFKVPGKDREYDEDTHVWTIHGERYIGHLEGVGLQNFKWVTRVARRGSELVIRDCRSGAESVQKGLFA